MTPWHLARLTLRNRLLIRTSLLGRIVSEKIYFAILGMNAALKALLGRNWVSFL